MTFHTGDLVVLVLNTQTVDAWVELASANGRSLMLAFDEALRLPNGGVVAERLPVMRGSDGHWREIVTGAALELRPASA